MNFVIPPAVAQPVSLDQLPSLPAAAATIIGLCDDPEVGLDELGAAVSLDPALSARLLRLANSAAYNRGQPITALDRAMMQLGLKMVKLTALGFVVSSSLSDSVGDHGDEVLDGVWQRCLVEAVACRELARAANLRQTSEAFLAGLFDGMGQLLGLIARPESFGSVLAATPWPSDDAAESTLGMTLPELVGVALTAWEVPPLYREVVAEASTDRAAASHAEVDLLAGVLTLARHASRQLLGHSSGDTEQIESVAARLGVPADAVDEIAEGLAANVAQLAANMDIRLGETPDYVALLTQARSHMIEASIAVAQEAMERSAQLNNLQQQSDAFQREARTDKLTGLGNRAAFDEVLGAAVADRISGATLSGYLGLLIFDIDHFKRLNDTHGHRCGDHVLEEIGRHLASLTRDRETVCRYGGEEFALIAPTVDDAAALHATAERIRNAIEQLEIVYEGIRLEVTVSVGAVGVREIADDRANESIIEAADRLLYQSKHGGRNRSRSEVI